MLPSFPSTQLAPSTFTVRKPMVKQCRATDAHFKVTAGTAVVEDQPRQLLNQGARWHI